jgi:hypothetical protein
MQKLQQKIGDNVNPLLMEEVANGTVYPIRKDTIIKYKNIVSCLNIARKLDEDEGYVQRIRDISPREWRREHR